MWFNTGQNYYDDEGSLSSGCTTDIKKLADEGCFCWYCKKELEAERALNNPKEEKVEKEALPSPEANDNVVVQESYGTTGAWMRVRNNIDINMGDRIRFGNVTEGKVYSIRYDPFHHDEVFSINFSKIGSTDCTKKDLVDNGYEIWKD